MTATVHESEPAPQMMRWSWRRNPKCVRLARSQLRKHLASQGAEELMDVGELLLSELLTNAVNHAHVSPGREIETVFTVTAEMLRVEVSDASSKIPVLQHATEDDEGGRGLALVGMLADRWRVDRRNINDHYAIGKTVWFEVDRTR